MRGTLGPKERGRNALLVTSPLPLCWGDPSWGSGARAGGLLLSQLETEEMVWLGEWPGSRLSAVAGGLGGML